MTSTVFVNQTTVVQASWLNDVNNMTYVTVPALNTSLNTSYVAKTSTTGAANIPVGNTTQRPTGSVGLFRFNNGTDSFEGFTNTSGWGNITGGSSSGGGAVANGTMYENKRVLTSNYTLTANSSAHAVGPYTIASNVTLTVPSGERFLVL